MVDGEKNNIDMELSYCEMCSSDMEKLGLIDGDCVTLENENGVIILKVKQSSSVPDGVIFTPLIPKVNVLTYYNPSMRGIISGKTITVSVKKYVKSGGDGDSNR